MKTLHLLQYALAASLSAGSQLGAIWQAESPALCVGFAAPLSLLGGLALPVTTTREALQAGVALLMPYWLLMPVAYFVLFHDGESRFVGLLIASLVAWAVSPTGALLRLRLTTDPREPATPPAT